MIWVESAGPPWVITTIKSAELAIQTALSRMVMAMVGARKGSVIEKKRLIGPAPSISAAS
jgi:hypothetical protein